MPILHSYLGTELHYSKLSEGLVLGIKKGQFSISVILNPDELGDVIKKLKDEYVIMMAKYNDTGMTAEDKRELRKKRHKE